MSCYLVKVRKAQVKINYFKHIQPDRLGLKRSYTIVDYYCLLVWCERKILFWLEIYDHLRPNEHGVQSMYHW